MAFLEIFQKQAEHPAVALAGWDDRLPGLNMDPCLSRIILNIRESLLSLFSSPDTDVTIGWQPIDTRRSEVEPQVLDRALEPTMTADEAYQEVAAAAPEEADFSQHRKCSHWRS